MTMGALTEAEEADLRALVAAMIPSSEVYGMPGADDALIFADILKSLGRDFGDTRVALAQLATLSGGSYAALSGQAKFGVTARFKEEGGAPLFVLNRVVLLCYYRDDRVMRALGQEPRSPFPEGHVVEQGDWSLLDPVRSRPPMWRKVN